MITAIPVDYNNTRFRSKTEARVAAGLDRASILWEYEPARYRTDSGTEYLPDFLLTAANVWLEVKPTAQHARDEVKAKAFAASGATVFYAFPNKAGDRLAVAQCPGMGSATWGRCRECRNLMPWPLSDHICTGCGLWSPFEDWADSHPARGIVIPMQEQDGCMIWAKGDTP